MPFNPLPLCYPSPDPPFERPLITRPNTALQEKPQKPATTSDGFGLALQPCLQHFCVSGSKQCENITLMRTPGPSPSPSRPGESEPETAISLHWPPQRGDPLANRLLPSAAVPYLPPVFVLGFPACCHSQHVDTCPEITVIHDSSTHDPICMWCLQSAACWAKTHLIGSSQASISRS